MKDFLSISDLSATQIEALIKKAVALKAAVKNPAGPAGSPLKNKSMAMIFDKASLRTRLSLKLV